jgi:cellulose synthase/poly-beta-1,6-N-acetylglucosamine synthase-like glycosyltransferase
MTVAALICLGVLIYTYLGYPVLIAALARIKPLQVRRDSAFLPTVSVLIPVFNARRYIGPKLDSLLALDYPDGLVDIIVCSDASDDGSDEVIRDYAERHPNIHYLRADQRSGKPAGINRMLGTATGEVLLMTDIRQPLDAAALRKLVAPLADPSVGAVSGNLVLTGSSGAGFYWHYEKWLRRSEGRFRSVVGVSGSIYVLRRSDMEPLARDLILDDLWVPMRLRLQHRKILFEESAMAFDEAFGDQREFGRKVRTLAGNYQLFARMPAALVPFRNPSFFEVMSHKVLRLVCPWALLVLALVSLLGIQQPLLALLALGQGVFYAAALAGGRIGRLGSLARTFVVLNAAAVVGLYRYLADAQKVTW